MALPWMAEVDRFCCQYFQLVPRPDFPSRSNVRLSQVHDAIYEILFAEGAVQRAPPPRYQLRILKELVSRVESSIEDWDEHVGLKSAS